MVYAWREGTTSWSSHGENSLWVFAKLAEDGKMPRESLLSSQGDLIDWTKVPVDTPILVKDYNDGAWIEGYFCKYENGRIYAWGDGKTSWTTKSIDGWDQARLA